jgi:hypothetical protein
VLNGAEAAKTSKSDESINRSWTGRNTGWSNKISPYTGIVEHGDVNPRLGCVRSPDLLQFKGPSGNREDKGGAELVCRSKESSHVTLGLDLEDTDTKEPKVY